MGRKGSAPVVLSLVILGVLALGAVGYFYFRGQSFRGSKPDYFAASFVAGEDIKKGDAVYVSDGATMSSSAELFTKPFFADPNIVSYYRFEGNSNDLVDNNDGVDYNVSYGFPFGKFGKDASFNGTSAYIAYPSTFLNYGRSQAFTISFWANSTQNSSLSFLSKLDPNNSYRGLELYGNAAWNGTYAPGNIHFELLSTNDTNVLKVLTDNIGWNDGDWHLITVTYDGSSSAAGVKIYLDGISESLTTVADTLSGPVTNSIPLSVGQFGASNNWYNGAMDDLVIFNRALSPTEVSALYNSGAPINNGITGDIYRTNTTNPIYSNGFVGFAASDISSGSVGSVVTEGFAGIFNGLTTGKQYYMASSSGAITTSPETTAKKVGVAVGSSTLLITNTR